MFDVVLVGIKAVSRCRSSGRRSRRGRGTSTASLVGAYFVGRDVRRDAEHGAAWCPYGRARWRSCLPRSWPGNASSTDPAMMAARSPKPLHRVSRVRTRTAKLNVTNHAFVIQCGCLEGSKISGERRNHGRLDVRGQRRARHHERQRRFRGIRRASGRNLHYDFATPGSYPYECSIHSGRDVRLSTGVMREGVPPELRARPLLRRGGKRRRSP